MRLVLKRVEKEIQYLNSINAGKNRFSSFGSVNDTFDYTGTNLLKKYRIGKSGFFYEFTRYGVFNQGRNPDLHLSIIDDKGTALPHVTFKPDGYNGIEFHYGIKNPKTFKFVFWVTKPQFNKGYDVNAIKNELIALFEYATDNLVVYRYNVRGVLERTPYKFNPYGTVGRAPTTELKQNAEYRKQILLGKLPVKSKRGLFT